LTGVILANRVAPLGMARPVPLATSPAVYGCQRGVVPRGHGVARGRRG
jgi:hypothetical protein